MTTIISQPLVDPVVRGGRNPLLRIRNLSKHYGSFRAVDDISLDIYEGEFLSFLGASGSGKTTTLMMLAGFETPSSGDIFIGDQSLVSIPAYKRGMGMVFQRYSLFPHLSVFDNIAFPLRVRKENPAEIKRKVDQAIEMVKLGSFAHRKPAQLSGGQQQRVAIARALVYEPKVLLMDEPLGALDKKLREDLQDELRHIHQRLRVTVVYVTHDQEEALRLSERIAVFHKGTIESLDSGYNLYESPPSAFVGSFLGNSNFLRVTVTGNADSIPTVEFEGQRLQTHHTRAYAKGDQLLMMIRPEKLLLITPQAAMENPVSADTNQLMAKVVEEVYLGDYSTFHVTTPGGANLMVSTAAGKHSNFQPGDEAVIRWNKLDTNIYSTWNDADIG